MFTFVVKLSSTIDTSSDLWWRQTQAAGERLAALHKVQPGAICGES